jgi:hypothetical protein
MIFSRRPKNRAVTPHRTDKPRPMRRLIGRVCDGTLVLATTALVVYIGFISHKVVGSYTVEEPTPAHSVRLQVVDASSTGVLLKKLVPNIEAVSDMKLEIKVAETRRFDVRPVAESFVISREEDLTASRLLAVRLGLNPDQVEYKPLEDNRGLITATLVVGTQGVKPNVIHKKETKV